MRRLIAAIVLATLTVYGARAHDWYEPECCSGRDCSPAKDGEVVQTPAGWLIVPLGVVVPYNKARTSEDEKFHFCRYEDGKGALIVSGGRPCLYVPAQGY